MERKDMIKKYIERVSRGEELEIVRADFRRDFAGVPADEIADAEKLLMEEGMQLSEVQQLCDVHAALFEGAVQTGGADEPAGHPLYIFSKENEGLARLLDSRLAPAYAAQDRPALQPQGKPVLPLPGEGRRDRAAQSDVGRGRRNPRTHRADYGRRGSRGHSPGRRYVPPHAGAGA